MGAAERLDELEKAVIEGGRGAVGRGGERDWKKIQPKARISKHRKRRLARLVWQSQSEAFVRARPAQAQHSALNQIEPETVS